MSYSLASFTEIPPHCMILHLQELHRSSCDRNDFQLLVERIANIPSALLRLIIERYREQGLQLEEQEIVDVLNIGGSGLSKETISENLHVTVILDKMDGVCAVCLGEYTEDERIRTLICRHEFHADCIEGWLLHKNACPLCRAIGLPI